MKRILKLLALPAASLLLAAPPAWAILIGSQVTGSLQFTAPPPTGLNYFDPVNGFVNGPTGIFPGGSLNSAGTTVTISGSAIEFGYKDFANTDSADFTGSQLIVTDISVFGGLYNAWTMTLTDTVFASLSKVSDNFVNGGVTGTLVGDVLTVSWAGGSLDAGTVTLQAVFNVVSIPEPTTIALAGLGAAALMIARRRR